MSAASQSRSWNYWWIASAIFAVSFTASAWMNRIASDDFEFLRIFRELGWWDAAMFFRDTWNTRWTSILWLNTWFGVYDLTGSLLPYHLCTLTCLFLSSRYFLKNLFLKTGVTDAPLSLIAACWSAALFYASFSIADTWFWNNTSTMYGWSHIYAMLAAGSLLSPQLGIKQYILLLLAGAGIGGGNEPFALTTILICTLALLPLPVKQKIKNTISVHGLIILLSTTIAVFLFAFVGDGHSVRSSLLPDPGVPAKLWILVKSLIKLFGLHIPSKAAPLLLLLFPFYLLGTQTPFIINSATIRNVIAAFVIICVVSIAPIVWLMSEMGPERAWSQVSLYTVVTTAFLLFALGTQNHFLKKLQRLYHVTGVLAILYVSATGASAVFEAKAYNEGWDLRMQLLKNYKTEQIAVPDTIRLEPLPASGWLHSAEIEKYPEHFTNVHLQKFVGLSSPIIVEHQ